MKNLISQAISAFEEGNFEQLEQYLRPILMQEPSHEVGLLLLARFHRQNQNYSECQDALTQLITNHPNNAEGFISMGNLFAHQGFQERSISWYHLASDLAPERIDLWQNWGHALFDLKKYNEAQKKYAQALILDAKNPNLISSYASCLRELGDLHGAEQHIRTLLQTYPGNAQYWGLLAVLMRDKHHNELADRYYKHALQLEPKNVIFLSNRGAVLVELGDMIQAKKLFDEALKIITQQKNISNLEQTKLLSKISQHLGYWHLHQGDYQTGFRLLESRFLTPEAHLNWYAVLENCDEVVLSLNSLISLFSNNDKNNEGNKKILAGKLAGKHILLVAEQGFGDNIQFIRYAQALMQRYQVGAITVICDESLKRLFQKQNYITQVITWHSDLFKNTNTNQEQLKEWLKKQKIDYFSSIISLPYFFDTTIDDLYAPNQYLKPIYDNLNTVLDHISMNMNQSLELSTVQWLKEEKRPKIGIVWSAGLNFSDLPQDAKRNNQHRSISLKQLKPLLELDHLAFVSLQKDEGGRYRELIDLQHEEPVFHQLQILKEFYPQEQSNTILDFATTAQIIYELDLVITVDTSIVHLAAALGKPTWLLNRKNTCWRFATKNSDFHSIWYPSIRIFSQKHLNEWDNVIMEVMELLS